jgi:CRISPR-associated protein Cas2
VSYDISDDRRRYRLAKIMLDYGQRVQKSVFECRVDEKHFLKMKSRIDKVLDMEKDSVRYYFLCGRCQDAMAVSGWGTLGQEEEIEVV